MRFDDDADLTLQHAIADGDRLALGDLYDRYAGTLLALAQAILGPTAEAQALVHDLFLEVWRHASHAPGPPKSLRMWLFARMRDRCLQERRSQGENSSAQAPPLVPPHWRPRSRFDVPEASPPNLAPLRARVREVLVELSQDVRQCLHLVLFEGLTVPELARRTCSSERAVMARFAQAQGALCHGLRGDGP